MSDVVEVFVEIPKGSRNKYEWDHHTRRFKLDRMLFSAVQYPGDYGFIPRTWAEDSDALDALVVLGEPTFPGCTIDTRVVGVFFMADEKGPDKKIIGVPDADPRWGDVRDLEDIPKHMLDEIAHFFSIYKDLEAKKVKVEGFGDRKVACEEIARDLDRWRMMDDRPEMP
jgi:inorganic pyrophosphatase